MAQKVLSQNGADEPKARRSRAYTLYWEAFWLAIQWGLLRIYYCALSQNDFGLFWLGAKNEGAISALIAPSSPRWATDKPTYRKFGRRPDRRTLLMFFAVISSPSRRPSLQSQVSTSFGLGVRAETSFFALQFGGRKIVSRDSLDKSHFSQWWQVDLKLEAPLLLLQQALAELLAMIKLEL